METHLKELEKDTNTLCEIRVRTSQTNKTPEWTMDDLKEVLKQLGNDKSRDPEGHINEIFKESVAGTDLLEATLKIMNLIKKKQKYPNILEKCNISSIHKKKSKRDFENYRGIFRVQILRSILDRLMYNDCYYTIDNNITDGNVGARKQRSVRDNIFVISAILNSVTRGSSPPIQVQVMDAEKCFDKLWLQACINALYEAGINHDHLNLLYIENKQAQIAIKINDKLSARIKVSDIVMQGSVWGSIKCTTLMDQLNKNAMSDESLQYYYKGDPQIPIGILGMVDDTLAVADCGNKSIRKNAVVNSFVETQRLTLSKEKSVVLHFGKESKCNIPCPALKVHKDNMNKEETTKYLGHILSTKGGLTETIEDRRNKGWGKISTIMGILSEVDMGVNQLEAGLLLREAILISGMLYSAEAWSGLTEKQLTRMEVVDTALLVRLTGGHSKCATEFNHMETGTWKLRHHLTYLRLLYHHHILTRDKEETISKFYYKQKQDSIKGDWFQLLQDDFDFIQVKMNEEKIIQTPKSEYKKIIKALVNKAAFGFFLKAKEGHSKLDKIQYTQLRIQPYLSTTLISNKQKELLYILRSNCHSSKMNFKKLNRNNLKCVLCSKPEDQVHTFTQCQPIINHFKSSFLQYSNIFGSLEQQIETIQVFYQIDQTKQHIVKKHLLPGGRDCQDPCTFDIISDGAADTISS